MELLLYLGCSFAGSFGGLWAYTYAAQRGDIGDHLAKAADNVKARMGVKNVVRFHGGASPPMRIYGNDVWASIKGGLLVVLAGGAVALLEQWQPTLKGDSYLHLAIAGGVASILVALKKFLSDNTKQ